MKATVLYAGCVLLSAMNIGAQPAARLYAVTFYNRQFITIDTNSGAGALVTNLPINSLDIAAHHEKLWLLSGSFGSELLSEVDAWTGAILGQRSFASSIKGGEGAFDFARDGTALAARVTESTGTLFRIDWALTNVVPITAEGGLVPSLDGLAFDADGLLYGLSQNVAGNFTLYVVQTNTGAMTAVGGLGISFPVAGGAVAGLAFAPDGTLYAALGNPNESRFYRVSKSSGAATLIGSIGFPGVSGIRFFLPPPGPLAIARQDERVRLSWPHVRGGVLESATTVTGIWQIVTLPLTTNGAEVFALVPRDERERYFRLAHR